MSAGIELAFDRGRWPSQAPPDRSEACTSAAQVSDGLPLREREEPWMQDRFQCWQGRTCDEGGHTSVVVDPAAIGIDT